MIHTKYYKTTLYTLKAKELRVSLINTVYIETIDSMCEGSVDARTSICMGVEAKVTF